MKFEMKSVLKIEFTQTLKKIPLTVSLARDEIRVRYVRSILGPFWLVLTTAISAFGLGYIWSILFNQDKETFIPALCIGLVIWQFLSSCVLEAPDCFVKNGSIIKNTSNPVLIFPITIVLKNLLILFHNFVIIVIVFLIYPPDVNLNTLLLIPGLLLVILNLICAVCIIAFLGARYRDLSPAISSLMTILFFLSPVIYKPEQLGIKEKLIWFNPFTYLISLIRDPMTGQASPLFAYGVMTLTICIGCLFIRYLLARYRYRFIFWL